MMNNSGDADSDLLRGRPDSTGVDWEAIDWDAHIENPPEPKVKGKIKVLLKYIGRSKPFCGKRK